ncbi:branched chain amino acid aminotransferase [Burkholderia sp. Nafp2/4-1b]|uniref:branched-chain amino acid aminotransferase n=1 Tax=Burkholderia sp. Nafp2/4-1b TaxID=2116686 RepID=UPI000EF95007|nr:branched-chain amino acid aminotransferase [Burkholderia sp. Nafp2/4-1b]RKT99051.1 branched chain amino acid aminotransferase [Burkholderia sp. Nafp2/4-1b]
MGNTSVVAGVTVHKSTHALGAVERQAVIESKPPFGSAFTDHMAIAKYTPEKGWHDCSVVAFAPFEMHPASAVLHYGQAIFEGLKAYATPDGGITLFRPSMNAHRFAASATRMGMPPLSEEMFLSALKALVNVERDWVPRGPGASLYLRPMMFARDPRLLTKPSETYTFAVIASPVSEYFSKGLAPVSVWISKNYIRAARGGTGEAKCAGNYAASFAAQAEAMVNGCEQVVWLDAIDRKTIEEMGGMNLYFVFKDGAGHKLVTPKPTGSLLKGVTRDSLLTLALELGYAVEERVIDVDQWRDGCRSGEITETFACGTAAVIVPVGRARTSDDEDIVVNGGEPGPVATQLRENLLGIQHGQRSDPYGWTVRVV